MEHNHLDQVTVVCVTYQSHSLIESLAETLRPFSQVIVVDNGSSDGTAAAVRKLVPQAKVIERVDNVGFGMANNEAMAQVRTTYALLLNPDCDIKPDSMLALLSAMQRYPSAGIVAPQNWDTRERPQKSFRQAFYESLPKTPYKVPDGICCAQWLRGCCLLVRTSAFARIGGFDENFFLYYEDDDLCLRMRVAGFECLLEPAAVAWHAGGKSSAPSLQVSFRKHFHYARSRHLAICKYQGNIAGRVYLGKTMLFAIPASLLYALMLQGRRSIKWLAWGASALSSSLAANPNPAQRSKPA